MGCFGKKIYFSFIKPKNEKEREETLSLLLIKILNDLYFSILFPFSKCKNTKRLYF